MLKRILCLLLIIATSSAANAALITQSDSVSRQSTDFNSPLLFNLFDLGPGFELTSVSFSLAGTVFGTAEVESRDASPSDITISVSVELTLFDTSNSPLVVSIPLFSQLFKASAYDGFDDKAGTSGATFTGLTASQTVSEIYTDVSTLNAFTGSGTVALSFGAEGKSTATGSGNISSFFSTEAAGDVEVIYEYRAVDVSEPSMIALFGLGLMAAGGMRRFRK